VKLLIFSDIHSDAGALQRLMAIEADYYFCAGDLVNWARGLDAMGEIMKPRADRLCIIPGNHESADQIEASCTKFGFHNFHGGRMRIGDFEVAGLGYSNPTPFRRRTGEAPPRIRRPEAADCGLPRAAFRHAARSHYQSQARRQPVNAGIHSARAAALLFLRTHS
jgi:hypothetical protein